MDKKLAKNIFFSVICSLLLLGSVLGAVFGFMPKKDTTTAFNSDYTETDNAVVVGEIWGGSTFNYDTTKQLFKMLGNSESTTLASLTSAVGSGAINATTLRGYSTAGNTAGKSIVVTLGGFKWIVTYLTKDSDGNLIATLWAADSHSSGTYGNSSSYWGSSSQWTSGYPASMYGTSYMAVVTLNNGGTYANITTTGNNTVTSTSSYTCSSSHKYAAFTHSSGGIRPYIVQPNKVPYQTTSQGKSYQSTGYALMNESLATNVTGYYSSSSYQTLTGYTNWGDDYLWLPSLSETGNSSSKTGMWQTSQAERANSNTYLWLRSGYYKSSASVHHLYSSGDKYDYGGVNLSSAIRPALHLNLTMLAPCATKTITLNQAGGSGGTTSISGWIGDSVPNINIPTRNGYTFAGYYTGENGTGTQYYNSLGEGVNVISSSNLTLYAKWTSTLNLDLQGGTGVTSITATYGAGMPSATAPTRNGYNFAGYYSALGGGGAQYYSNTMSSVKNCDLPSGTTLYAKWSMTVTLNMEGGNGGSSAITVVYNADMPTATAPTRSGYAFGGYYTESEGRGIKFYNASMESVRTWTLDSTTSVLYAKWIPTISVTVSGSSTSASVESEMSGNLRRGYAYITPNTGHYVQKFSFDNVTFYEVVYASAKITNLEFCVSATYESTMSSNDFVLEFSGIFENYLTTNGAITVYLVTMSTPYESLKEAGGASVSGVAVSATTGGSVTIIGDDYDEMLDADTITVKADICLVGYKFDGWYLASDMGSCISTEMSEKFKKSEVFESQLVAVFSPIDSSAVNNDTSN